MDIYNDICPELMRFTVFLLAGAGKHRPTDPPQTPNPSFSRFFNTRLATWVVRQERAPGWPLANHKPHRKVHKQSKGQPARQFQTTAAILEEATKSRAVPKGQGCEPHKYHVSSLLPTGPSKIGSAERPTIYIYIYIYT